MQSFVSWLLSHLFLVLLAPLAVVAGLSTAYWITLIPAVKRFRENLEVRAQARLARQRERERIKVLRGKPTATKGVEIDESQFLLYLSTILSVCCGVLIGIATNTPILGIATTLGINALIYGMKSAAVLIAKR